MRGWERQDSIDSCLKGRYISQINSFITGHMSDETDKIFGEQVLFTVYLPRGEMSMNFSAES